jgi:hypothetical protein
MSHKGLSIDFQVIPLHLVPNRANGGRYDHCPIAAAVKWAAFSEVRTKPIETKNIVLRWRQKHRIVYTDIVQSDDNVLRRFE